MDYKKKVRNQVVSFYMSDKGKKDVLKEAGLQKIHRLRRYAEIKVRYGHDDPAGTTITCCRGGGAERDGRRRRRLEAGEPER